LADAAEIQAKQLQTSDTLDWDKRHDQ
jgi:hypothetical protein